MYSFEGKRVVVAGGNSGLGRSIASNFVAAGADVLICSRNEDVLRRSAEEIGARYLVCDISNWLATREMVEGACKLMGGIDVGVNSAGFEELVPLRKHSEDHVARMVGIQFTGAVYFMQHVSNAMANGGAIVNISSLTGTNASPGYIAYGGAKAGLNHASQVAAVELAKRKIRVNVVSPTVVRTPMVEKMFDQPGFEAALLEEHPLGELPSPQDVSDAVLWLAGDRSRCVTGENIHIDSGARQTRMPRAADIMRHASAS